MKKQPAAAYVVAIGAIFLGAGLAFASLFSYFVRYSQVDSLIGEIDQSLYLRLSTMFALEKFVLGLGAIVCAVGVVLAVIVS
ncbi:MAG: hypothetical protein ACRCSP_09880, partial [Rhodoglobus sp.]